MSYKSHSADEQQVPGQSENEHQILRVCSPGSGRKFGVQGLATGRVQVRELREGVCGVEPDEGAKPADRSSGAAIDEVGGMGSITYRCCVKSVMGRKQGENGSEERDVYLCG